jgi:GDP-L-fucose synthase
MSDRMHDDSRIYVAGHRGLAGSAIVRRLRAAGYHNLITRTHAELDLIDQRTVRAFFAAERPEYVFLAAAKVGGILANDTYPADFLYQNLMIQGNVIDAAYRSGVKRLLFLGSACIYPKLAPQPLKEEYLLSGPLEPTNEAYAIAKIAGLKMCAAYSRQYGAQFASVMPNNLYGPGDNYDLSASHVLPALLRKMHEAKISGRDEVIVWGSGRPRREFVYSDDMADACLFVMTEMPWSEVGEVVNVGTGVDVTILDLAQLLARVVGFEGRLAFDASKPDGTPRKLLDVSRLRAAGWQACTPLEQGLLRTYADFVGRFDASEWGAPFAQAHGRSGIDNPTDTETGHVLVR